MDTTVSKTQLPKVQKEYNKISEDSTRTSGLEKKDSKMCWCQSNAIVVPGDPSTSVNLSDTVDDLKEILSHNSPSSQSLIVLVPK